MILFSFLCFFTLFNTNPFSYNKFVRVSAMPWKAVRAKCYC